MSPLDETSKDVVRDRRRGRVPGERASGRRRSAVRGTALLVLAGAVAAACGTGMAATSKAAQGAGGSRSATPGTVHHGAGQAQKAVLAVKPAAPKPPAKAAKPAARPAQTPAAKPKPGLSGRILSAAGLGPIRFGMTVSQAEAAAGVSITQNYWSGPMCQVGQSSSIPGVVFNIDHQTDAILAAEVVTASAGIETLDGIGLGDSVSRLKATYGDRLHSMGDYYNGNGVTDVDSGQVAAYSLETGQPGRAPSVVFMLTYAEGAGSHQSVHTLVAGYGADAMTFC